ncbi:MULTISPECIES: SPOR domain-containing protein [unclassified Stenotrophomonas]|jgi:cell division protein FtsN|uniref:SPOR domain-containing protein n=1 Tax=unclassified Stenotrophomonas TaxID=196198 RepID=UPI0017814C86|nr:MULTISPECIES: SPOR domain-containing protein [unclassified Stenotrophomonas]MBD8645332.1 SPOR domain-containing protein [Stenotrophomonas sp. CFBP 13724]MDY1035052.1 SPOR domain-containing protein [Stenotrophomonas sp. CFBP8980]
MAARRGKSQARRNSSQGTPGWVWLVAGVAIAAVVFLAAPNLFKGDADGFLRAGPRPDPNAQPAPVVEAEGDVGTQVETPAAAKPATPAKPAATQYDFYTLLPGKEVEMSDAELAASTRAEEQRRARSEAQRAQAALEGKPVPAAAPAPASTAATTTGATATVASTASVRQAALPTPLSERPAAPATTTAPPAATTSAPAATATATAAAAPAESNVRYILQAGAFGASGDAETTKAKLAMIGLAARVESAQINGKTVYRVRMGPYGTAGELSEAKQKLDGTGLQAMAIKAQ